MLARLSICSSAILESLEKLKSDLLCAEGLTEVLETAKYYCDAILTDMETLRKAADEAEALIPDSLLPYPTYDKLLYSVF